MAASNTDLANALRYGPQTQQLVRRSQYLTDALKQLQTEGSQGIRSPGELAAKLLATAILQRKSEKAQDATLDAIKADRDSEISSLVGALRPAKAPTPPAPVAPQDPAAAAPTVPNVTAPPPVQQAPLPPAQPQSAGVQITPDIDAMVRTVWGEARGEGPDGQAAVAGVIANRAKERGLSPRGVVMQPGQFEPWANPRTRAEMERLDPASPEYQAILQNIAPVLQGQNPVGGADHFYSPGAQAALGRKPPSWDNGSGQDLGRHRFFDLEQPQQGGGDFQLASGPAPQQSIQIAGELQPGMIPSAPGSSPSAGGPAPAAPSPQASAAGANPEWPNYVPTEAEIGFVEGLLRDPRTFDQGRQEALKLRQKMAQPAPAKIVEMQGVQFYVPETPGQGGPPVMIPVPKEALTRNAPADQFGVAAPRGTILSVDPFNNIKPVITPPTGQQIASNPGEPYRETYVPGGQNDPFRVQAPQQGYQYQQGAQGLSVAPIPGSTADPRNASNVASAAQQYRDMAKTVVDDALKVKKNFEAVRTGFAQQNGPGDVVIVNGLQRLIDEGVVRGEDIRTLAQSMGLQGTVEGWTNYLSSGGSFDPAMRKKLYTIAEQLYRKADDVYRTRLMGLQPGFDELYGEGNFSKFVFPQPLAEQLGWAGSMATPSQPSAPPPQMAPPSFKPGSPDAALAEAVRRNLRLTPQQQQRARDLGLIR
jgi:N-acetylmuramoyl-L-alanine amidase